jgi:hypothetical protein
LLSRHIHTRRATQHDGITRGCCVVAVVTVAAAAAAFVIAVVKCVCSFVFVLVCLYVSAGFVSGTRTVFNQHVNKQLLNLTFWHRNFFNFLAHPVYKM